MILYIPPPPPLSSRYMMYINGPGEVYLIDRDNSVFLASQIVFPARKRPNDCVKDTLVDGVS